MKKEPLFLAILRYLMLAALLFLIAMLYWSSLLVEQDLKTVKIELANLKKSNQNLLKKGFQQQPQTQNSTSPLDSRKQIDPSLPNLLTEDPFDTKTLPKLLGDNFQAYGIQKLATFGKPENLHPFSNWNEISNWLGLATAPLSTPHFGIYETYAPNFALKMELRKNTSGKPEYWLHLRDDVFWQPLDQKNFPNLTLATHFFEKHPVTAHDVKLFFDAVMNPYVQEPGAVAMRTYIADIEEVQVVDDLTLIVRWKTKDFPDGPRMRYIAKTWTVGLRPFPSFVYKYFPDGTKIIPNDDNPNTYRNNSVWAQNFSKHWATQTIVSCGPWLFDGRTDRKISFRRNPEYFDPLAALTEGIEYSFKDSPDAIWQSFKAGELDSVELPPNQLLELKDFMESPPYKSQAEKGMSINKLNYLNRSFSYLGWNQARSIFKSKKVRQALTMAIDRKRIIDQILNGMGVEITGTFPINSKANDSNIKPWPYDPERARTFLAEEGWYDSDGDGIIDKVIDGKKTPFRFKLTYFVKSQISKAICEYVATGLKELGILCDLNGVDIADISALFDDKGFDAYLLAWTQGVPPESLQQIWSSSGAKEKGSSNAIGFANAEVDKIIEEIDYEYDPKKREELYFRFDAILHEEQPYTFLYTPITTFVYRNYLQNVFIPADRQDLIPGADIEQPQSGIYWIKKEN